MVMYLNFSLMVVIGLLLPVIASHAEEDEGEKLRRWDSISIGVQGIRLT